MKKLYIFFNCQNYNSDKILVNKDFVNLISTAYSTASKDRMPCIYFQKWENELESNNIRRGTYKADLIDIIYPLNPFIVETEYLYKLISPIGNRNVVIRSDESLNSNYFSILENILENSKLQIDNVEVFGLKDDINFFSLIRRYINNDKKITTFTENLI